jgi:hypothetical protein
MFGSQVNNLQTLPYLGSFPSTTTDLGFDAFVSQFTACQTSPSLPALLEF